MPVLQSKLCDNDLVDLPKISVKEVQEHVTKKSCWICVDGFVYDVTEWLSRHPGGEVVILNAAGLDVTDIFNAYHPAHVRRMLKPYVIGRVEEYVVDETSLKFRDLVRAIDKSDIMTARPEFYIRMIIWYAALLSASILCVIYGRDDFWISVVAGGVIMALYLQQIAFMGHDLGHTAVFHNRRIDSAVGLLIGNVFSGISMGWWKATHNVHHCATNSVEGDPDIQHSPFFAVAQELCGDIYSLYHDRTMKFGTLAKILIPSQSKLYYVVMALARCNLYVQSYIFLLRGSSYVRKRVGTTRAFELAGLVLFAIWFSSLVLQLPTNAYRICFFLLSHSLAGILHVQITLSHFSMAVYSGQHPLATDSFIVHQLKTCLDIDCPEYLDLFHGGLQFQLPHHLFPRVPRCNLRRLRVIVEEFCTANDLRYHHLGFIAANKLLLTHLRSVSEECRLNLVKDMINARG